MIKKLHLEDSQLFGSLELNFSAGFCVFSGPSGSGKSVLMDSLLACFGLKEPNASVIEADIVLSPSLINAFEEELGIDSELLNIKIIKKDKIRYFVNFTPIAKRQLAQILSRFTTHIHSRGGDELGAASLLGLLDRLAIASTKAHAKALQDFAQDFTELDSKRKQLNELQKAESNRQSLIEIAEFEIAQIHSIAPKSGEYEELLALKKTLSHKEKLLESIAKATAALESSSALSSALALLDKPELQATLEEALNDTQATLEEESQKLENLQDLDVESLLARISALSSLITRYGSIEAALAHEQAQREKLEALQDSSTKTKELESRIATLESSLSSQAQALTQTRQSALKSLQDSLQALCLALKLKPISCTLCPKPLDHSGSDVLELRLDHSSIATLSAGEFNRLRLAVMCVGARLEKKQGVLILDEIDANLSGEESEGVARVLQELAKSYQVFAISHQPHMPSLATAHYLVSTDGTSSQVRLLDKQGRVQELARMISGANITQEALDFASRRLEQGQVSTN